MAADKAEENTPSLTRRQTWSIRCLVLMFSCRVVAYLILLVAGAGPVATKSVLGSFLSASSFWGWVLCLAMPHIFSLHCGGAQAWILGGLCHVVSAGRSFHCHLWVQQVISTPDFVGLYTSF
jgi:pheromone shutdown protein TraB